MLAAAAAATHTHTRAYTAARRLYTCVDIRIYSFLLLLCLFIGFAALRETRPNRSHFLGQLETSIAEDPVFMLVLL